MPSGSRRGGPDFRIGSGGPEGHPSAMSPAAKTDPATSLHREVTVQNRQGIHARPSASFVKLASQFQCDVFIEKDGETINGKSIMGLLMLAAGPGSRLRIVCTGADARTALEELCALVDARFGED